MSRDRSTTSDALVELVCDIDDMSAEYLAAAADRIREAGALDVTVLPVTMKHGRQGARVEVLCRSGGGAAAGGSVVGRDDDDRRPPARGRAARARAGGDSRHGAWPRCAGKARHAAQWQPTGKT